MFNPRVNKTQLVVMYLRLPWLRIQVANQHHQPSKQTNCSSPVVLRVVSAVSLVTLFSPLLPPALLSRFLSQTAFMSNLLHTPPSLLLKQPIWRDQQSKRERERDQACQSFSALLNSPPSTAVSSQPSDSPNPFLSLLLSLLYPIGSLSTLSHTPTPSSVYTLAETSQFEVSIPPPRKSQDHPKLKPTRIILVVSTNSRNSVRGRNLGSSLGHLLRFHGSAFPTAVF